MILSWYKDMEVDMKDVEGLEEGKQYTFGFALSKTVNVLMCRKSWTFSRTKRMQYTNINGNVCSEFASGKDYYFAVSGSCIISSLCTADIFNYSTVKVVEEDAFQSLLTNHFKVQGVNYLFPQYEFEQNYEDKYQQLEVRYSFDSKTFTKVEWKLYDNVALDEILPTLTVGSVVSIVIFNTDRTIVFAAKECHVVDYPNLVTSKYHVAKGYAHKVRFSFDIEGMEAFKVVLKSGNTVIAQKASNSNVSYLDVNVDDSILSVGAHRITFIYSNKVEMSGTSNFVINVYNDPNKDVFTFNTDFSSCHYQKTEAVVFTGHFRSDVNITDDSPLIITAAISKGNSNSLTSITTFQGDESQPHVFTFSLEAGTLSNVGDIRLYIYENNDSTYPIHSSLITVTKPTVSTLFQTYFQDKQGTLSFNDLTCPLQNITLTSLSHSPEAMTVNCVVNDNSQISCPYTLSRGFDSFSISVDGYHVGDIDLMRDVRSAVFATAAQSCYVLSKDNKLKIQSDEYNFKYVQYLTVNNGDRSIIVTPTSDGIAYNYNDVKNEITLTVHTDVPGLFTVDFLTDVNGNNSTFRFMDVLSIVQAHFRLEQSYLFKSNYFDHFNVMLDFDVNLNPSDYINAVHLDDANVTCVANNSIGKSKMNCTFDFATLHAPRDFKIKLKCSDDLYTPSQTYSVYRYELLADTDSCQTKGVDVSDYKMRVYAASALPNETKFNVTLTMK